VINYFFYEAYIQDSQKSTNLLRLTGHMESLE